MSYNMALAAQKAIGSLPVAKVFGVAKEGVVAPVDVVFKNTDTIFANS